MTDGAAQDRVDSGPVPRSEGSLAEVRRLGAGQRLGRYILLRRIASGGMAEVYAARAQGISGFAKRVAIKRILPQFSLNKRFVDMLVDEAKITVSLTHPNIAQVYELGLEEDTYYIVMEYVDGRPLNRLMQRMDQDGPNTIAIEHAVHIMAEVTKGLEHAHKQRDPQGRPLSIVHRDVSPQNILIAYSGDVKLIDFGIARAAGRAARTSAGVIKGKLRYLAPEIAVGEEPDHRADLFCVGIVLFELLTGEAMFAPRTDVEALEMASNARVRSPRLANPGVPEELEAICMKALRRDREERYQSARELNIDLRRFLNQHYPAYVGSELGDRIQELFSSDIAEDQELNGAAERIADSVLEGSPNPSEPARREAPVALAPSPGGSHSNYQLIVTRGDIDALVSPSAVLSGSGDIAPEALARGDVTGERTRLAPSPGGDASELVENKRTERIDAARALRLESVTGVKTAVAPAAAKKALGLSPIGWVLAAVVAVVLGVWAGFKAVDFDRRQPEPVVAPLGPLRARDVELVVVPTVPLKVFLNGNLVREGAPSPLRLDNLALDQVFHLEVEAEGYQRAGPITFLPEHNPRIDLELRPLPPTALVEAQDEVEDVPVPEGGRVEVPRVAGGDARSQRGVLEVRTQPASQVFLGNKRLGDTPFRGSVPAGTHKLIFKGFDGRVRHTMKLKVPAGQVVRVRRELTD